MGGGGIEVLKAKLDSILSSLIISFIKIDSFKKYFYLNNNFKGELGRMFSDLAKSNNINSIDFHIGIIKEKFMSKDQIDIDFKNIANKLLYKLSEELFTDNKEDIIKEIFYGKFMFSLPNSAKEIKDNTLILPFDLSEFQEPCYRIKSADVYNNFIDLKIIIKERFKKILERDNPGYKNPENISLPDIAFISLTEINKGNEIKYYKNIEIEEIPYELVFFVKEEENGNDEKYFKENSLWFKYNFKNEIEIVNLEKIRGNPKILCYQKRNYLMKKLFANKNIFKEEQERILELMNQHIIREHEYENYYLLKKENIKEIENILEDENKNEQCKYKEVHKKVNETNLIKKDFITNPSNNSTFILVQEKLYKKFLEYCNIDYTSVKRNINDYGFEFRQDVEEKKYKIKFGENLSFIKFVDINNERYQEQIYICGYKEKEQEFVFEVFLKYFKGKSFENDVEKYISNRGGMEYFFIKNHINIENHGQQDIHDDNEQIIGELFILVDMTNYLDMNRYNILRSLNLNNNNDSLNNNNNSSSSSSMENPIFKIFRQNQNQSGPIGYNNMINNNNPN